MQLILNDEEARVLRDLLVDYLPQLKLEVARTDAKDLRHYLAERQDVCERLVSLLQTGVGAA